MLRRVAAREGLLLRFLDGDPEAVRLVETHAGEALATYERLDERLSNNPDDY